MPFDLAGLATVRTPGELRLKVAIGTLGIVAVTDGVDALVNLLTQPDRLWPSFVQTTLIAGAMSALFLGLLGRANLRLFEMKERFRALAQTDIQTGLLNRRGFFGLLEAMVSRERQVTLGVLDIDHFKRINDTHGHLVGDYVIAELGRVLGSELGASHLAGRVGGEEFAVALADVDPAAALLAAERLRRAVAAMGGPPLPPGLRITASIGLARIEGGDVMAAYGRADEALYEAKQRGRDQCVSRDAAPEAKVVTLPLSPGRAR